MIANKTLLSIEFDKILSEVKNYAVLEKTKNDIISIIPENSFKEAEISLKKTYEAYRLLYTLSAAGVYYFDDITDEIKRVNRGGTLSCGELLKVAANLKSARILKTDILRFSDSELVLLPEIARNLFINPEFEKEIYSKILSENEVSDNASDRLYSIRKSIRNFNAQIKEKLNSYIRGNTTRFLQDSVVTMRAGRYVIPVKSEYRSSIKGFIHDQSDSGATVFIEPEQVMELNNELKRALLDEQDEIHRILSNLSEKITGFSDALNYNAENISEIDACYAKARYSFENKCTLPMLNDKHYINIKRGRHPLIDKNSVVPVDISFGDKVNFLLITGPNTGGKTVTLKLVGLLTAMALSGLFVPCEEGSSLSFFKGVFCDVGDEQSIEQNLSTFSSHVNNIKKILQNSDENSLILIDEIGAGTDPDEGSAIALSIIKKLLSKNCYGIITTHYSKLKVFAAENPKIDNASMEFDSKSLKPLYKLNVGIPGSSNAIDICKTLGLDGDIILDAINNLSDKTLNFESVLKKAEEERRKSESLSAELEKIRREREYELEELKAEKEKIKLKREEIYKNARQETKRIVSDKLSDAEEIIDELKSILKKADLESREVIRASELKNRLKNSKYLEEDVDEPIELVKLPPKKIVVGNTVFVSSLNSDAKIFSLNEKKGEATVILGNAKVNVKISDLYKSETKKEKKEEVKIYKSGIENLPKTEINIIGKTSLEAITELENFISQAVYFNLEEIKVIHGVGEGVLIKTVRDFLKKDKRVSAFRRGMYGEGENGVTIITLK